MDNLLANKRALSYLASELERHLCLVAAWTEYGPLPWFCFDLASLSHHSVNKCSVSHGSDFSGGSGIASAWSYDLRNYCVIRYPINDTVSLMVFMKVGLICWTLLWMKKTNVKYLQNSILYTRQDAVLLGYLSYKPMYVFPGKLSFPNE